MSDFIYTCDRAQKVLIELIQLVGEEGLLQVIPDEGLLRQCVRPCEPCRRGKGPKRCRGWRTVVERGVLWFGPVPFSGERRVRLALYASCCYQRPAPGRQQAWDDAPLTSSVVALEIFDLETEELIERHHLDLANPPRGAEEAGQAGPVWHLQTGGNPAGEVAGLPTSWLAVPRWPIPPMDLTLAIELLAYSFFPDRWERLSKRGEWLRLITEAEQLVVSHFARHMADHFDRDPDQRDRTWLEAQDNETGNFDPRPGK